ncbi:PQ loop repeat-domain-containing protein [Lasiosphaeria hispida]|uniref:PQ loop repeat-domain-containing protein n=1 Tax=Lasiosphaeria hispida TaxID=260671 RepID=A0AAJ0MGA7_9PEZI|nr:PQ loop repeat-domain-containing protein [Lasiosphaeria hispida]
MVPPTGPLNLDVEAISGICGSVSIACWVVVFSPQIVENLRRGSAEGLSVQFIVVWLLGDVFNILGAVLQGVLPTMLILAIYYTIADFLLLGQCFYYRGFTLSDAIPAPAPPKLKPRKTLSTPDERTRLLTGSPVTTRTAEGGGTPEQDDLDPLERSRRDSTSSWAHLSPAVPLSEGPPPPPPTRLQALGFNLLAVLMVIAAGVVGWYISRTYGIHDDMAPVDDDARNAPMSMNFWGQIFGWLCAVLYLGSRLPQLLLNWRRKSTDGVSMLFFLFACLGNLTYVLSIIAFDPGCGKEAAAGGRDGCAGEGGAAKVYWRYILVNMSWLAGSAGTLFLDSAIFVQFFLYSKGEEEEEASEAGSSLDEEERIEGERWDQRPVLDRNLSDFVRDH